MIDKGYLMDWYINSVSGEDVPVWTEEHIDELVKDFALYPKTAKLVPIDRVLEIIDKQHDSTCDRYSKVGYMEAARDELRGIRVAVLALKESEGAG